MAPTRRPRMYLPRMVSRWISFWSNVEGVFLLSFQIMIRWKLFFSEKLNLSCSMSLIWKHKHEIKSNLSHHHTWKKRFWNRTLGIIKKCEQNNNFTRVFPILYWISLISKIRWVQLESVKYDWRSLKAFLCLPLAVGSLGIMVVIPDWESIRVKIQKGLVKLV